MVVLVYLVLVVAVVVVVVPVVVVGALFCVVPLSLAVIRLG